MPVREFTSGCGSLRRPPGWDDLTVYVDRYFWDNARPLPRGTHGAHGAGTLTMPIWRCNMTATAVDVAVPATVSGRSGVLRSPHRGDQARRVVRRDIQ